LQLVLLRYTMMKLSSIFALALVGFATASADTNLRAGDDDDKRRRLGGNKGVDCDKAITTGLWNPSPLPSSGVSDQIDGDNGEFPYDNFPCGSYPFDGTGEELSCTYYPNSKEYECASGNTRARKIIRDARNRFGNSEQPCNVQGSSLDGVRTWWWTCKL
jgi:hypothetical protein